ncbi:MAG: hypothetical protein NTY96_05460 [Bacteroidetes bacterium]|nr:hypothetical protein [Bacteroidota bacterium]
MAFFCRYWLWLPLILCLFQKLEAQVSYYDQRSGVEVLFPSNLTIFPHQWAGKKVNPDIRPVQAEEIGRIEDLLTHAFSKYPLDLLNANLDRVYVLKSMKFYGLPYGGTNYQHSIYLSDDTDNPWFTNEYIEQVFHHEFSSILIRNFPEGFDKTKWLSLNPPYFSYGKGGADAILQGTASMALDPVLIEKGFLSEYSTASLEEDINVFAQNLFTGGREFWRLVDLNDTICQKTRILIGFYHKINPVFTESYFRSFYYNTAQR